MPASDLPDFAVEALFTSPSDVDLAWASDWLCARPELIEKAAAKAKPAAYLGAALARAWRGSKDSPMGREVLVAPEALEAIAHPAPRSPMERRQDRYGW